MNSKINFKDKVVLITGSSMGIGLELCRQLLSEGARVVITGRNAERLRGVEEKLSDYANNLAIFQADASVYDDNIKLSEFILQKFGRLDILICNAGLSCYGELERLNPEVAKAVIDTNVYGVLYSIMANLPELIKSKGSILIVSSVAAFTGLPGYSIYSLSKLALKNLAHSISIELLPHHVSVGIAYVGFTENEKEKCTYTPDGKLVQVPLRAKAFLVSRNRTAKMLIQQIKTRKRLQVHSSTGKFTYYLERFFPNLTFWILKLSLRRKLI